MNFNQIAQKDITATAYLMTAKLLLDLYGEAENEWGSPMTEEDKMHQNLLNEAFDNAENSLVEHFVVIGKSHMLSEMEAQNYSATDRLNIYKKALIEIYS